DGKLYGRGVYDMKAAGAVLILLFKELAAKVSYPLGLQLVTDEEIGGANGTAYQLEQGVQTDFIIAGENTDFNIKNKAKGILWFTLSAIGKTGHGAYPWQGDNALWKIVNIVEILRKEFPIPTQAAWQTTINLAKIETSNTTFNKIPEDAVAWVDIRFIPEEKDTIHEKVRKLIPESFSIAFVQDQPAAFTPEYNPLLQKLVQIIERVTTQKPNIVSGHGAADVRFYTSTGSAGVEFGLLGGNHHADDEWIDIQHLEKYYTVMKEYLLSL
ncbi:MAG: M20/M25/M40 family metallo-hydrolase, partial [Patescibacteria group bacterium]|nr:M20/M25/M40 family metallo-hydrolase [Patescibacteria group bacterium]